MQVPGGAINYYTGGALEGYARADVAGLLKDRLEEAREAVKALCEPVAPLKDTGAYLHYFCAADTSDKAAPEDNELKRIALYKAVAALVGAFASLANELPEAGYPSGEIEAIRQEVNYYEKVRHEVKLASNDYLDMKVFKPAMRHLLDTYLRAEDSTVISAFDNLSLVD